MVADRRSVRGTNLAETVTSCGRSSRRLGTSTATCTTANGDGGRNTDDSASSSKLTRSLDAVGKGRRRSQLGRDCFHRRCLPQRRANSTGALRGTDPRLLRPTLREKRRQRHGPIRRRKWRDKRNLAVTVSRTRRRLTLGDTATRLQRVRKNDATPKRDKRTTNIYTGD